jgi:hypothetical protein
MQKTGFLRGIMAVPDLTTEGVRLAFHLTGSGDNVSSLLNCSVCKDAENPVRSQLEEADDADGNVFGVEYCAATS